MLVVPANRGKEKKKVPRSILLFRMEFVLWKTVAGGLHEVPLHWGLPSREHNSHMNAQIQLGGLAEGTPELSNSHHHCPAATLISARVALHPRGWLATRLSPKGMNDVNINQLLLHGQGSCQGLPCTVLGFHDLPHMAIPVINLPTFLFGCYMGMTPTLCFGL